MIRAYLGLGGNIGDPAAAMGAALRALHAEEEVAVQAVSRLYSTPPWGKTDQPPFLNACAAIDTRLSPDDLLDLCLAVERSLKRERRERWGPRTIDIDILDFGGAPYRSDKLTLPHPRLTERAFVLVPLADIAAALPVEGRTIAAWAAEVDAAGIEPVTSDGDWWRA